MNSFDSLLRRVLMDAADEDVEWDTPPETDKQIIDFKSLQAKSKELRKYIVELPPELREKARQCKDMIELNELIAENDVELSDDALAAAAGGGGCSLHCDEYNQGDPTGWTCPECGSAMYYWDNTHGDGNRYYCNNSACKACREHWLFAEMFYRNGESRHKLKRVNNR